MFEHRSEVLTNHPVKSMGLVSLGPKNTAYERDLTHSSRVHERPMRTVNARKIHGSCFNGGF